MKQTNERLKPLAQKRGDAATLDSLIDNNKSFIAKVANELFRSMNLAQAGLNLDTDDLKQAGNLGLWKTITESSMQRARHGIPDLRGSCHPQRHDGHGARCLCYL